MKQELTSQFSKKHIGHHKIFHQEEDLESSICKYFENCNISKIRVRDCANYDNCQTYKYYKRYNIKPSIEGNKAEKHIGCVFVLTRR